MDTISFRRAALEDKADVIRIHDNVYDGRDYLPGYFEHFLNCQNVKSYVAEVKGELVSYLVAKTVDNGDTVIARAGRCNPKYAGMGVYKKLNKHMLDSSSASINAFTAVDANLAIQKETFRKSNTCILIKPITRYIIEANNIDVSAEEQKHDIQIVTDEDLEELFSNSKYRQYLFPENRLVVDWVPFKVLSSNIPLLRPPINSYLFLSNVKSTVQEPFASGLFTVSTTFKAQDPPYATNLDIYGTDTSSIKEHIKKHIEFIQQITNGETSMLVFVESEIVSEMIKEFSDLGLEHNEWYDSNDRRKRYSMQYVYEKRLHDDSEAT